MIGSTVFPKEQSTTTVVFFLGGCTFTEIAAIRWMGKRTRGTHSNGYCLLLAGSDILRREALRDCDYGYHQREQYNGFHTRLRCCQRRSNLQFCSITTSSAYTREFYNTYDTDSGGGTMVSLPTTKRVGRSGGVNVNKKIWIRCDLAGRLIL